MADDNGFDFGIPTTDFGFTNPTENGYDFGIPGFDFGVSPSDAPTTGQFDLGSLFGNTDSNFSSGSVLGADPSSLADFGFDTPDFGGFGTTGGFGLNDDPFSFDSTNNGKNGKGKGFNPANFIMNLAKSFAPPPVQGMISLGQTANNISKGNTNGLIGQGVTALTGNGLAGMAANGITGNPSGGASTAFGAAGTMIGGPVFGAITGSIADSIFGNMPSEGPPPGVANGDGPSGVNLDPGMIMSGLGSLYLANQAGNDAKTLANNQTPAAAQGIAGAAGVPTLESMFGPDSSYAQNMRKQLERRDAAKGRRSQYGPREVELQAKLAEMASRAAPDYIRATSAAQTAGNTNQQTVNTAQRAADEQRLKILYTLGRESGLFKELGGLFKQQPTQQLPTNYLTNDWMQPAGNTDFGVQNIDTNYQPQSTYYEDL